MTKGEALSKFYNGFGIKAYPSQAPAGAQKPYIIYEPILSNYFGQQSTYPAVHVWAKTDSEKEINNIVDDISKSIGEGVTLQCDDGWISVFFTSNWIPVADEDITLKHRYTTLEVVFYTT